jgi:cytochrome c-type biogenesis protein
MDQLAASLEHLLKSGSLGGSALAVALAYAGGVLSSLTPCIYPMIPITVGVVGGLQTHSELQNQTAEQKKRNTRSMIVRGFAYVMGMAIVYAFLGVAAGITGKVFGTFTNTSGWYLGLGILMTLAALMMIDVLPFDPQAWMDRIKRSLGIGAGKREQNEKEATMIGAFALGASSGFLAAPCTTPVLTAILAFIAQTQSVFLGLSLMLAFAFGLGTILMVIAAFAGNFRKLPRAGAWMNKIKIFSGILILAYAEYLIYKAGRA